MWLKTETEKKSENIIELQAFQKFDLKFDYCKRRVIIWSSVIKTTPFQGAKKYKMYSSSDKE